MNGPFNPLEIFVGGLLKEPPEGTTHNNDALFEYFSQFGEVNEVDVKRHAWNGNYLVSFFYVKRHAWNGNYLVSFFYVKGHAWNGNYLVSFFYVKGHVCWNGNYLIFSIR